MSDPGSCSNHQARWTQRHEVTEPQAFDTRANCPVGLKQTGLGKEERFHLRETASLTLDETDRLSCFQSHCALTERLHKVREGMHCRMERFGLQTPWTLQIEAASKRRVERKTGSHKTKSLWWETFSFRAPVTLKDPLATSVPCRLDMEWLPTPSTPPLKAGKHWRKKGVHRAEPAARKANSWVQAECPDALRPILIKFGLLCREELKYLSSWKPRLTSKLFGLSLMKIDTFDHDWGHIPGFSLGRYFGEQTLQSHWVFLITLHIAVRHSSAFCLVSFLLPGIRWCGIESLPLSYSFHSDVLYSCLWVWRCHTLFGSVHHFPMPPCFPHTLGS